MSRGAGDPAFVPDPQSPTSLVAGGLPRLRKDSSGFQDELQGVSVPALPAFFKTTRERGKIHPQVLSIVLHPGSGESGRFVVTKSTLWGKISGREGVH